MAVPNSLTFRAKALQSLSWTLTNVNGSSLSGATVTATLYTGRNRQNPDIIPGTPDSIFNNITLVETPTSSGIYIGSIPSTFDPSPTLIDFTVVITATGTAQDSWQVPAVILSSQISIDLVQLNDVKSFLGFQSTNTDDDGILQLLITSFSQYVLNKTSISSFNSIQTFTETYDGNGNTRLFLRNQPIRSLVSLVVGSYQVPPSTGPTVSGIYVEDSKKSIAFRWSAGAISPPYSIYPYGFTPGQGNVVVNYTAGYSSVPFDLYEAVIEAVAINYRRKDWLDLASKNISTSGGGAGTTTYRKWFLPPGIEEVINFYSRYSWS
jgi:hypothetical protein